MLTSSQPGSGFKNQQLNKLKDSSSLLTQHSPSPQSLHAVRLAQRDSSHDTRSPRDFYQRGSQWYWLPLERMTPRLKSTKRRFNRQPNTDSDQLDRNNDITIYIILSTLIPSPNLLMTGLSHLYPILGWAWLTNFPQRGSHFQNIFSFCTLPLEHRRRDAVIYELQTNIRLKKPVSSLH